MASGYDPALLTGPISPPATANESLATKPFAQQFYQKLVVGNLGPSQNLTEQFAYINFYANLIKKSDEYLVCWGARQAGRRLQGMGVRAGTCRARAGLFVDLP